MCAPPRPSLANRAAGRSTGRVASRPPCVKTTTSYHVITMLSSSSSRVTNRKNVTRVVRLIAAAWRRRTWQQLARIVAHTPPAASPRRRDESDCGDYGESRPIYIMYKEKAVSSSFRRPCGTRERIRCIVGLLLRSHSAIQARRTSIPTDRI